MSEEVLIEEQEENETREPVSNNQHPYDLAGEWFVLNAQSCLLYTSPSPRDQRGSRMPSSA